MEMKVNVLQAEREPGSKHSFSYTTTAAELDAQLEPGTGTIEGEVKVEGEFVFTGKVYRFTGNVTCEKSFVCDLCLNAFVQPQNYAFAESFQRKGEEAAVIDNDDGGMESFTGEVIDLMPLVRDTILTAQPLRNLCRPDCRGLCSRCGADLNEGDCGCDRRSIDPRLAALQDLLKKS